MHDEEKIPGEGSTPDESRENSSQLESVAAKYERLMQRADRADHLGTVRRFEAAEVALDAAEVIGKKRPVVEALVARTGRRTSWIYEELRLARIYKLDDVRRLRRPWTHLQAVVTPAMRLRGFRSLKADNEGMVREEALKWLGETGLTTVDALKRAMKDEDERRHSALEPDPDPDEVAEVQRQEAMGQLAELLKEAKPLAEAILSPDFTDDHRAQFRALAAGTPLELADLLRRLVAVVEADAA